MDLGGVEGLLHVSELSWNEVPDPHTVLKVGEVHTVKVLKVDREAERVSLSLRAMVTDPFKTLTHRLAAGHVVLGFVSSVRRNEVGVRLLRDDDGVVTRKGLPDGNTTHLDLSRGDQV